jgi:hypothetical protein
VLGGVFICYRREDSAGFSRLIYDRLTHKLGHDSVFFDVDNIAPGLDFVDILSERVGKCDALIAVIGKSWVSSAYLDNQRRLDDPNDFVRIEIEAALARKIRVIPILVDGAMMPRPDDLPDSLKKLTRRQGIEISHTRFDSDVERLTHALSAINEELSLRDVAGARSKVFEEPAHRNNSEIAERERLRGQAEAPRVAGARAAVDRAFATPPPRRHSRFWLNLAGFVVVAVIGSTFLMTEIRPRPGDPSVAAPNPTAPNAQYQLGNDYYYGVGGRSQDYQQAMDSYQKASDQGDSKAQYMLGTLYEAGKGVAKDYAKAREWYQKAADQGDILAQYRLGYFYQSGLGGPQDYYQAKVWYQKAADQGSGAGLNALKRLGPQ